MKQHIRGKQQPEVLENKKMKEQLSQKQIMRVVASQEQPNWIEFTWKFIEFHGFTRTLTSSHRSCGRFVISGWIYCIYLDARSIIEDGTAAVKREEILYIPDCSLIKEYKMKMKNNNTYNSTTTLYGSLSSVYDAR